MRKIAWCSCKVLCNTLYSRWELVKSLSGKPATWNLNACMIIVIIISKPSRKSEMLDNSNSWSTEFNQHMLVLRGFNSPRFGILFNFISRPSTWYSTRDNNMKFLQDKLQDFNTRLNMHVWKTHNLTGSYIHLSTSATCWALLITEKVRSVHSSRMMHGKWT